MANERFPVNEAQIVALFMESVAYGVYMVTFAFAVRILFFTKRFKWSSVNNWALASATLALAIFATLDVALGLRHCLDAFIFYQGPGGSNAEFADISYWVNVMKTVNSLMMLLIVDGFLVYRCWVVYFYNWKVVAAPVLLWLGNAVCCAIIIYITATLRTDAVLLNVSKLQPFFTSFMVTNLVTNGLVTSLIAHRIWSVSKQATAANHMISSTTPRPASKLEKTNRVVIESGLLNLISVFIGFITFLTGSNAVYGVTDTTNMVIGSTFNLIIIRIYSGTTAEDSILPSRPPLSGLRFAQGSRNVTTHITNTTADNTSLDTKDTSSILGHPLGGVKVEQEVSTQYEMAQSAVSRNMRTVNIEQGYRDHGVELENNRSDWYYDAR